MCFVSLFFLTGRLHLHMHAHPPPVPPHRSLKMPTALPKLAKPPQVGNKPSVPVRVPCEAVACPGCLVMHWSNPFDATPKRRKPVGHRHGPRRKHRKPPKPRRVEFLVPGTAASVPASRLQTAFPTSETEQGARVKAAEMADVAQKASEMSARRQRIASRGTSRSGADSADTAGKGGLPRQRGGDLSRNVLPGIGAKGGSDGNAASETPANTQAATTVQTSMHASRRLSFVGENNEAATTVQTSMHASRRCSFVGENDAADGAADSSGSVDGGGGIEGGLESAQTLLDKHIRSGEPATVSADGNTEVRPTDTGTERGGGEYNDSDFEGDDDVNDDDDDAAAAADDDDDDLRGKRKKKSPIHLPDKDVAELLFESWIDELAAEHVDRSGFGSLSLDEWLADGENETLGYLKSQVTNYTTLAEQNEYNQVFRSFAGAEGAKAGDGRATKRAMPKNAPIAGVDDDGSDTSAHRMPHLRAQPAVLHRAAVNDALAQATQGAIKESEVDFVLQVLEIGKRPEVTEEDFQVMSMLANEIVGLQEEYRNAVGELSSMSPELRKAKEMFFVNQPDDRGEVDVADLETALRAGRTASIDIDNALRSIDPHGTLRVSFVSFLANLPLFVSAHADMAANALGAYNAEDQRESMADSIAAMMAAQKAAAKFTKRAAVLKSKSDVGNNKAKGKSTKFTKRAAVIKLKLDVGNKTKGKSTKKTAGKWSVVRANVLKKNPKG